VLKIARTEEPADLWCQGPDATGLLPNKGVQLTKPVRCKRRNVTRLVRTTGFSLDTVPIEPRRSEPFALKLSSDVPTYFTIGNWGVMRNVPSSLITRPS